MPLTVANNGMSLHLEQLHIELIQFLIGDFFGCTNQVRRNTLFSTFKLSLMEKTKSGRKESYDGSSFVNARRKCCSCARFIMVLKEAGQLVLIIESRLEVFANRSRVTFPQPVIETFVVSVIETFLLKSPLHIPIDFRNEKKFWERLSYLVSSLRPEWLGPSSPGSSKHIRQDQHCHIATDAIALPGNSQQLSNHGFLSCRVAVVELKRVGPTRKVRIASIGQKQFAFFALGPRIIMRLASEVKLTAKNVVFGMILHPRMIGAGVVGNKIQ